MLQKPTLQKPTFQKPTFQKPKQSVVILAWVGILACPLTAANPNDAMVSKPVLVYRSVFTDYKMMTDEPIANWREINDSVGRIGGWRAYLKEAQANPQSVPKASPGSIPESTPSSPSKQPASPAHSHHNHGK